ncbi:MAG: hypothetical protein CMP22_02340 [Rickettsiales bacterium]|nr:hypothetical protein [Rickettsiales bacterium]|tara:strand:+ start:1331 stop:2377 length:1047 start_codon:yes stop_codon:yes gene_type:complete
MPVNNDSKMNFLQNSFFFFASMIMLGYLLVIGKSIIIPFVIATFFWYLINALAHKIVNMTTFSEKTSLFLAFVVITLAVAGFVQVTKDNVQAFIEQAPAYQANINIFIDKFTAKFGTVDLSGARDIVKKVNFGGLAAGIVAAVSSVATMTITILIYLAFLFLEQSSFSWKLKALFPKKENRKNAEDILQKVGRSLESYIGLKTLASIGMGICGYAVLVIMGVDNAVFWALIFGLLNFIPYVGPFIGTALPVFAALVQFGDFSSALVVLGGLVAVAFIIGNIIEPKLFGNSLNLSPLVILLSLAIWGSLWGIIGMILCIPMMVSLMIILYQFDGLRPYALLMSEKEKTE